MHDTIDQQAQQAERILERTLRSTKVGQPLTWNALSVFPIYAADENGTRSAHGYETFVEAVARGHVAVDELGEAEVDQLSVRTLGLLPVLIFDGDFLMGGQQNRIANATTLLPPQTTCTLPVRCVEARRWDSGRGFRSGEMASPSFRSVKEQLVAEELRIAGRPWKHQSELWQEVEKTHRRYKTISPTRSMSDAYRSQEMQLDAAQEAISCPANGPIGLVVVIGGHAKSADLFAHTETLQTHWSRLIRSAAMDALDCSPRTPSLDSALRLLQRPLDAAAKQHAYAPSVGLGVDVRIEGNGVAGSALVHDGCALHIALFRRHGIGQSTGSEK